VTEHWVTACLEAETFLPDCAPFLHPRFGRPPCSGGGGGGQGDRRMYVGPCVDPGRSVVRSLVQAWGKVQETADICAADFIVMGECLMHTAVACHLICVCLPPEPCVCVTCVCNMCATCVCWADSSSTGLSLLRRECNSSGSDAELKTSHMQQRLGQGCVLTCKVPSLLTTCLLVSLHCPPHSP
jgi:hypothetical protein